MRANSRGSASPRPDTIGGLLPVFMEAVSDRVRTKSSRQSYLDVLKQLDRSFDEVPVGKIGEEDLVRWVRGDRGLSPNWVKSRRSKVCRFFRWCLNEGHIEVDPARRLPEAR